MHSLKSIEKWILVFIGIVAVCFLCACSQDALKGNGQTPAGTPSLETETPAPETESAPSELESASEPEAEQSLEVHFIDVGQGDAILALCGEDAMLIDGGNSEASDIVYSYLKKLGVDHLKYIICTHPDEDHVGGLSGALNFAAADTAYCSELEHDSDSFQSFLKYLAEQNVPLEIPEVGTKLSLGDATGEIIGPVYPAEGTNDNSLVVRLEYGETSFLFTGDAEAVEEDELIRGGNLKSTVLKVGHHGSNYSTSDAFLDAVAPEYAIISCGAYNMYGHPADGLLNRLKAHEVQVFRTDMQGDIICVSDGKTVAISPEREPDADTFLTYYDLYGEESAAANSDGSQNAGKTTAAESEVHDYVLNVRSKKFHWPDCDSVNKMKEENKQYFTGTRDDLLAQGYEPCGNCHP